MTAYTAFAFEPEDMAKLVAVKRRLYAPEPLSADARRDLANALDAILANAIEIPIDTLPAP